MFLIGLRTITFLFYLINEKKRNTLAILLKAFASFKVIIPFSEYEVINRNSKKRTRAPADMSKFRIKSSGDLKPGFHMIAPIARVAPIARNSVQTIQAIIWKQ